MAKKIFVESGFKVHLNVAPVPGHQANTLAIKACVNGLHTGSMANGINGGHHRHTCLAGVVERGGDIGRGIAVNANHTGHHGGGVHGLAGHNVFVNLGIDARTGCRSGVLLGHIGNTHQGCGAWKNLHNAHITLGNRKVNVNNRPARGVGHDAPCIRLKQMAGSKGSRNFCHCLYCRIFLRGNGDIDPAHFNDTLARHTGKG